MDSALIRKPTTILLLIIALMGGSLYVVQKEERAGHEQKQCESENQGIERGNTSVRIIKLLQAAEIDSTRKAERTVKDYTVAPQIPSLESLEVQTLPLKKC